MKLLALTDLHGNVGQLDAILEAAGPVDIVLLGGDITQRTKSPALRSGPRKKQRGRNTCQLPPTLIPVRYPVDQPYTPARTIQDPLLTDLSVFHFSV
jgi:hypothetical protein